MQHIRAEKSAGDATQCADEHPTQAVPRRAVLPRLIAGNPRALQRDGEDGRKKIAEYTRYLTVALALIDESGCMIAAPSANTSGKPSPTEAGHVALDLDGKIPMILDGGPVGIGIESTIIDLTEKVPMILRPGYITKEMLEEVLGEEVRIDPGIIASDSTKKPKAPGMKYKHYAPKADLVLVEGEQKTVVAEINALVREKQAAGLKVGVVATDETESLYQADYVVTIGARSDEDAIARHLYKILREFDDWNVDAIYSESFSTPRIGQAIMNRLMKAAGHQVIHV